jgi:hypothetical protein
MGANLIDAGGLSFKGSLKNTFTFWTLIHLVRLCWEISKYA